MAAPFPAAPVHAEPAKTARRSRQTASVSAAATAESWKSTATVHAAKNAVKNWMSAFVTTAKNVSAARMIAYAKTDLRSNSLSRATVPAALIYHNTCSPHRLNATQRRFAPKTVKSPAYPAKTAQNAAGNFCAGE